jgi:hypothetical protein
MSATPTLPRKDGYGLRELITIAALAGTIGGWAGLAFNQREEAIAATAQVAPPPAWVLEPPLIPTLVPLNIAPTRQQAHPQPPAPLTVTRSSR